MNWCERWFLQENTVFLPAERVHIWLPPCRRQRQAALQLQRHRCWLRLCCSCPWGQALEPLSSGGASLPPCVPQAAISPPLYSRSSFWRGFFLDTLCLHHFCVLSAHPKTPVPSQAFLQDSVDEKQSNRPTEAKARGSHLPSPHHGVTMGWHCQLLPY